MSAPAPFDHWSADLEPVLRRYLAATPVPPAEHSALLVGVALALAPHANPRPAQALGILVDGVGEWLCTHGRAPASMPPIHRGAMLSPSLEPLPLRELWRTRHGLHQPEPAPLSTPSREAP